ncbi:SNF2-related protein, partial [Actinacidiphila acididurans]
MGQAGGSAAERKGLVGAAAGLGEAARGVIGDHAAAVGEARGVLRGIVAELAEGELRTIPVGRLKDVTEGRLRLGAIEAAGYESVADVLTADRYRLRQIPGVGRQTADQAVAAAGQIARAVEETVAVRFDVDRPTPGTTALLVALHRLVRAGPQARRAVEVAEALAAELEPLLERGRPAAGRLRLWLAGRAARAQALAALDALRETYERAVRDGVPELLRQSSVDLLRDPANDVEAWVDFEVRSAEYYGLLAEISGRGPDPAAAEGFLPADVAERVRVQELDDTHRRVSLRGYQSFGARFALAQRRVILGDEMGLGKTVQAIAALAHLAARGRTHFLVVCPAGVLVNWTREIETRSALRAIPLHGPDRYEAFAHWRERGGVGITTYDALRGFPAPGADAGAEAASVAAPSVPAPASVPATPSAPV